VTDLSRVDPLGWLGEVSQAKESNGTEKKEIKTGFSTVEKVMIAGVLLNAAGLWWQISRSS
jgi:hypothetical protein